MEDPIAIDKKLIDQLLTDYKKPEDIIGENVLLKQLTKAILERALTRRTQLENDATTTVLHSFTDGAHGARPLAGVVEDAKGNLFGTVV